MTPQEVEQIIDMLAEKLGPMAQVVWEAYIAQAVLMGMRSTCIAITMGVLVVISACLLGLFVYCSITGPSGEDRDFCVGASVADALVFVVLLLGTIWVAVDAYMRVHNPGYYAIQMLLGR